MQFQTRLRLLYILFLICERMFSNMKPFLVLHPYIMELNLEAISEIV